MKSTNKKKTMVDIATYRSRVGSFKSTHLTKAARLANLFGTRTKFEMASSLVMLIMGLSMLRIDFDPGVESNPGPMTIFQGSITDKLLTSRVDAIVNAANAYFTFGGGVCGAIFQKAGKKLDQACAKIPPGKAGECVLTEGFNVGCKYILHAIGPDCSKTPFTEKGRQELRRCYYSIMDVASSQRDISTIAMVAISTGIYNIPKPVGAQIAVETVNHYLTVKDNKLNILFCVDNDEDYNLYMSHISKSLIVQTFPEGSRGFNEKMNVRRLTGCAEHVEKQKLKSITKDQGHGVGESSATLSIPTETKINETDRFPPIEKRKTPTVHNNEEVIKAEEMLNKLGYKFSNRRLVSVVTEKPFDFNVKKGDIIFNQQNYENIGKAVEKFIYGLMVELCSLCRIVIPVDCDNIEEKSFIFMSQSKVKTSRLLILVNGSGSVQAGQFSRKLIINDSLDSGSMLPYINRAQQSGFDVLVMNTNGNKVRHNVNPYQHFCYVWKAFVLHSQFTEVAIVAHSYGGEVMMRAVNQHPGIRDRLLAVALTDSCHLPSESKDLDFLRWLNSSCRNWVTSSKPLGDMVEFRKQDCPRISAGTLVHEETSWKAFEYVWKFINELFEKSAEICAISNPDSDEKQVKGIQEIRQNTKQESNVISVDSKTNYIGLTALNTKLQVYGYTFNNDGELRYINLDNRYELNNQYEVDYYIGELIDAYFRALLTCRFNLRQVEIPIDRTTEEGKSVIFVSENFETATYVVLLVHGCLSGKIGQWSQNLIVTDNIYSGSQIPYIERAQQLGYGVLILNPYQNNDITNPSIKIRGSETHEEHFRYVWKTFVQTAVADKVVIVTDSTGMQVTMNVVLKNKEIRDRICAVAITAGKTNMKPVKPLGGWIKQKCKHWIGSNKTINTYTPSAGLYPTVSGGTMIGEEIPIHAIDHIWNFINDKINENSKNVKQLPNLVTGSKDFTNIPQNRSNQTKLNDTAINTSTTTESKSTLLTDASTEEVDMDEYDMTVGDSYPVFTKEQLQERLEDFPNINVTDIKTDYEGGANHSGWTYINSELCDVFYTIGTENAVQKIALKDLICRGFPHKYRFKRLTREKLNEIASSSEVPIHIVEVEINDISVKECNGSWIYTNAKETFIVYNFAATSIADYRVRLDHLLMYGFTKAADESYRYYSFIEYNKREKAEKLASNDEVGFLKILKGIDDYYKQHPQIVKNNGIQKWKGPQSFAEKEVDAKFHYYGNGVYRFYRHQDMLERIEKKFDWRTKKAFELDPLTTTVEDDKFIECLNEVHDNIRINFPQHHDKFIPFAGPQIANDRKNNDRIKYMVKYRKTTTKMTPEADNNDLDSSEIENNDVGLNVFKDSSFRICDNCGATRLIDKRARRKYLIGDYYFNGNKTKIQFNCSMLVNKSCETGKDIVFCNHEIEDKKTYCVGLPGHLELEYHIMKLEEVHLGVFKVNDVVYNNYKPTQEQATQQNIPHHNYNFLSISTKKANTVSFGSVGVTKRFRITQEKTLSNLNVWELQVNQPAEAVCCQPWLSSPCETNQSYDQILNANSLIRLLHVHQVLNQLKLLSCIKCGRNSVGFENFDDMEFIDEDFKDFINISEVLNGECSIKIDSEKFRASEIHVSDDISCSSICRKCSDYYDENGEALATTVEDFTEEMEFNSEDEERMDIDDAGTEMFQTDAMETAVEDHDMETVSDLEFLDDDETPHTLNDETDVHDDGCSNNTESEESDNSEITQPRMMSYRFSEEYDAGSQEMRNDSSECEEAEDINGMNNVNVEEEGAEEEEEEGEADSLCDINTWGPENLMSLDIYGDDAYKAFCLTLTKVEQMICTPLHLALYIVRSFRTDVPFSKNGSICYPLKRPLVTEELPFTDLRNLPLAVIQYTTSDQTVHEAKVDLNNIARVKFFMERQKRCPVYNTKRPYYRLSDHVPFTTNAMTKLRDLLESMRINDDPSIEVTTIRKIPDTRLEQRLEKEITFDEFSNWIDSGFQYGDVIRTFYINETPEGTEFVKKDTEQLWNELTKHFRTDDNDVFINVHHVLSFAVMRKWLTPEKSTNVFKDVLNEIAEEFEILSTDYTNDGTSNVTRGDTTVIVGENPDEILMQGLKGSFLDKFKFRGPDRDNPKQEFSENYFPLAFPFKFRSGDACPFQGRPIDIKKINSWKIKYLDWLAMQKEVACDDELNFHIYNLKRRIQSWDNATIILANKNINDTMPTRQEIESNANIRKWCASNLLRLKANVIDSKPYWRRYLQEMLGGKRHMESKEDWRPEREWPILSHMFSTNNASYNHGPSIHRLLSNRFRNDNTKRGNVDWLNERRFNALKYPWVISWVGTFMAELDSRYFSKIDQNYDFFFNRAEYGDNGNLHFHRISFARRIGELVEKAKSNLSFLMNEFDENNDYGWQNLAEKRKELDQLIENEWEKSRQLYTNEICKNFTNWNAARTSTGKQTNPERLYKNDLARLNMAEVLNNALESGDFSELDHIYNSLMEGFCRHQMHSGAIGKHGKMVTSTDKCAVKKRILDKDAMKKQEVKTGKKSAKIYKEIYVCKRRKPQPELTKPTMYRDPHKPQITLVSTECNDGFFNGCSPYRCLLHMANCDDKATVPAFYMNCPIVKYVKNEDGDITVELAFYSQEGGEEEYAIKYATKGPIGNRLPVDILMAATENLRPEESVYNVSSICKAYNQYTLNSLICIFNASQVIFNIPLMLKNINSRGINVSGVNTIRTDYDQETDMEDYTKNNLRMFDRRLTHLDPISARKYNVNRRMSTNEFFDVYTVEESKQETGGRQVTLKKRRCETIVRPYYRAVHMTPNITMKDMNPNGKYYWQTCQNIIFWRKKLETIAAELVHFDNEDEKAAHWIKAFDDAFPNGDGLPPYLLRFYRHYSPDQDAIFPDIEEESSESEDETTANDQAESGSKKKDTPDAENEKPEATAKKADKKFYQTKWDRMRNETEGNDNFSTNDNNQTDESGFNPPGHDFMEAWLGDNVVHPDEILRTYQAMTKTKGIYSLKYNVSTLNKKQLLFHNLVTKFVADRIAFEKGVPGAAEPEPLRLFLTGHPGSGKSHAMKTTMCSLVEMLGEDWREYVKCAAPTGAAVSVMKFDAMTIHRLFGISISETECELPPNAFKKFINAFGSKVVLLIIDEFSMMQRKLFHLIYERLSQADYRDRGHSICNRIGIVMAGDPAQILPIGDTTLWSTKRYKSTATKCGHISLTAVGTFRDEFGLEKCSDVTGHDVWLKYSKDPLGTWSDSDLKEVSNYRKNVFKGKYKCVVLDEIKRKESKDPVSTKFVTEILSGMRYGHATKHHIKFLKDNMATEEDLVTDPLWKKRFILMGYHFYNPIFQDRATVDGENAKATLRQHQNTGEPIMQVEAIHTPAKMHDKLKTLSAKEFQNLPAKFRFCRGNRVMLLSNTNPSLELYNSAIGTFVGPLYLQYQQDVTLKTQQLKDSELNGLVIGKQIDCSGKKVIVKGSLIVKINDQVANADFLDEYDDDYITITVEGPQCPPALPDYMVIDFEGYSEMGGPAFFPDQHMKNYVPIPRQTSSRDCGPRDSAKLKLQHRTSFRIEGGDSESGFKAQGSTHERDELRISGYFDKSGLALTCLSRVTHPKHLYVRDGEMPNHFDIRLQRLSLDVIDAEMFELELRINAAVTLRKESISNPGLYGDIWSNEENAIADIIHHCWRKNVTSLDKILIRVKKYLRVTNADVEKVIEKLTDTEENLLNQEMPCLSKIEKQILMKYRDHDRKNKTKDININSPKKRMSKNQKESFLNAFSKKKVNEGSVGETNNKKEFNNPNSNSKPPSQTQQKHSKTAKTDKDFSTTNNSRQEESNDRRKASSTRKNLFNTGTSSPGQNLSNNSMSTPGFENGGNTCYANATIQLIYRMDALKEVHQHYTGNDDCLDALKSWFRDISISRLTATLDPLDYVLSMNPPNFFLGNQYDASEFFINLSAKLRDEYPIVLYPNLFKQVETKLHCHSCRMDSTNCQVVLPLPIALPEIIDPNKTYKISELLNNDLQTEPQPDYRCEFCMKVGNCEKSYTVKEECDYILLNLQIGKHDPITGLQFKRYPKVDVEMEIDINNIAYKLVGFVSHLSYDINKGLDAGHYIANIIENGCRVTYDDASRRTNLQAHYVTRFNQFDQPYIILYRKKLDRSNVGVVDSGFGTGEVSDVDMSYDTMIREYEKVVESGFSTREATDVDLRYDTKRFDQEKSSYDADEFLLSPNDLLEDGSNNFEDIMDVSDDDCINLDFI